MIEATAHLLALYRVHVEGEVRYLGREVPRRACLYAARRDAAPREPVVTMVHVDEREV
jgi:hypothetical protein